MFLWQSAAGPRRVLHISRGRRMGIHRPSAGWRRLSACMCISASAFGAFLHDVLYAGYPLYIVDTAEERNGLTSVKRMLHDDL